jgi:pilus assembly protein CpaF
MFTNRPAMNGRSGAAAQKEESTKALNLENQGRVSADVYHIRDRVQRKLLAESDGDVNLGHQPQMRQMIETFFNQVLAEENLLYTRAVRARLLDWVIADIMGYGPLEPLLQDPEITEVMVNGPKDIYIERRGIIETTEIVFENDEHLMRIIDRIVSPLGRRVDEASPMVDARLPSGYRVNATIPPLSASSPPHLTLPRT